MSNCDQTPRVSIGLPVYNAEAFIAEAIESLLAQTYPNIEVIISDNASSDATAEICRHYASMDPRVVFHQNPTNIGSFLNHNQLVDMARGDYFMWAGHDDVRDPRYVEECLEVLEKQPHTVLCYAKEKHVDENGRVFECRAPHLALDDPDPAVRFSELMRLDSLIEYSYGLVRKSVMARTPLHGIYADSDRVLFAEIGLYGPFVELPHTLLIRKVHSNKSTVAYPSRQERVALFDPNGAGRITFPYCREFREGFQAISRVPLAPIDRMHCYRGMLAWGWRHRRQMWSDVEYVFVALLRPFVRRFRRLAES